MIVKAEQLHYSIGKKTLLSNISFTAHTGELLVILGANGAGKSTLLKLISKELKPTKGTVILNSLPLQNWRNAELAKCRAVLAQQTAINLPFTATEIVMMGRYPHFRSTPATVDFDVVHEVMDYVGIAKLADQNYLTLSSGEQQKVQLARVLAQIWDNPSQSKLLLLDEPINALDIQYQHQILQLVKKLTYSGFNVITVLHDLNLALQYADKLLMLKEGKQVALGDKSLLTEDVIKEVFNVNSFIHRKENEYTYVAIELIQNEQYY